MLTLDQECLIKLLVILHIAKSSLEYLANGYNLFILFHIPRSFSIRMNAIRKSKIDCGKDME